MTIRVINGEAWMDTEDLCPITGWSKSTIESRRSRGSDLPPCHIFDKKVRYKKSDVDAWVASKRRVPSSVQLAEAQA